ncbi:MAG: hypothetical protein K2H14_01555 [Muribaculaceae bacterium]|nr:hypothetical protein [Muribaculaceae bacterium]
MKKHLLSLSLALCMGIGANADTYSLVTDASTLAAGDKIIIATDSYALGTTQNKNNRAAVSITVSNNKITDPTKSVEIITLEESTDANYPWTLKVSNGYLYNPSANNYLRTSESAPATGGVFNITIDASGQTQIVTNRVNGGTSYEIKYNSTNNLFACYSKGQTPVSIYRLDVQDTPDPSIVLPEFTIADNDWLDKASNTVYKGAQVTISAPADATDWIMGYSINGGEEQVAESAVTLTIDDDCTITAYIDDEANVVTKSFNVATIAPLTITPAFGAVAEGTEVTIACDTEDATIEVMLGENILEGTSFTVTEPVSVYAVASHPRYKGESTLEGEFTIKQVPTNFVVDVLTKETFVGDAQDSNAYATYSYTSEITGIVYSAQMATGNSSIQLRSKNSESGIVVTENNRNYTLYSVEVEWNSNTANERTLDFYGKDVAYSDPKNLYNTDSNTEGAGNKIGSLVYGTSTSFDAETAYEFIGLRSKDGAQYISKITLYWVPAESPVAPEVPEVKINGEVLTNFNGTQQIDADEIEISFTETEGHSIYYKLDDGLLVAAEAETTDDGFTKYDAATPVKISGSKTLSFYSQNDATGAKSDVRVLKFDVSTGIESVVADGENGVVEYFNLHGVRVDNPANGLYIRRQGNSVEKVIVK